MNFREHHQQAGSFSNRDLELLILEGLVELMATVAEVQAALDAETTAIGNLAGEVSTIGEDLVRIAADIEALRAGQSDPTALDPILAEINANAQKATDAAAALTASQTNLDAVDPNTTGGGTGGGPLALDTTAPLPDATVGTAYAAQVVVTGGTPPLTFTETPVLNPAGLSMDSATGAITGTPTTAGALAFHVTVTDSAATPATAEGDLTITVS